MKIKKLKVKTHKIEVVWASAVEEAIYSLAEKNGWVFDKEEVSEYLYSDPSWTWGDAAYTLIEAKVFIGEVFSALEETSTVKGKEYSFEYFFKLVSLVG